jgi:FdhD protein
MKQPPDSSISVDRTITRIGPSGRHEVMDVLLREERYELVCNGIMVAELHCMPSLLRELAVGRLRTLGLLQEISALQTLCIDEKKRAIETTVVTSSAPDAATPGDVRLAPAQVHALQQAFNERCDLFRATGAAHSCALATPDNLLLFCEDIARHNALDKVIGAMLLQDLNPDGKILIFSGRLASDMLSKVVACGVKLLIAPGAPSLTSVEMAEAYGITLLGFVRRDNINIYTCPQRIC